jgi:DNA-binding NtrC family response regulator
METILIVDDDQDLHVLIADILQDEGYDTVTANTGRQALRIVKKKSPHIVLLDMQLPDMSGMNVLEEIKKIDNAVITIMLTAYGDVKDAVDAMKLGAYDYLTKPFDNEELVLVIKKALQTRHLSSEVENLKKQLAEKTGLVGKFIGESSQIRHILKQVKIIAPTNITVILQGESGTGKELVANMIHHLSPRKNKPFIPIDCGAIPETLVESELFGHEKGAFTGADTQQKGKFEEAEGGTLFLDEISNLPKAAQVKLLRVIQERQLQRIGGRKHIKIDVRIITATNIDLTSAAKQGKFRDDLFHRLNEFHIVLPPLRERKEDILVLAKYFLDEANREFDKIIKGFSSETAQFMLEYPWTGNVRELRNEIRKAALLTESDYVMPNHLSSHLVGSKREMRLTKLLDEEMPFEDIVRKVEKMLIERALEQTGGNKVKAAKILQINRKRLYRKMESLDMR